MAFLGIRTSALTQGCAPQGAPASDTLIPLSLAWETQGQASKCHPKLFPSQCCLGLAPCGVGEKEKSQEEL